MRVMVRCRSCLCVLRRSAAMRRSISVAARSGRKTMSGQQRKKKKPFFYSPTPAEKKRIDAVPSIPMMPVFDMSSPRNTQGLIAGDTPRHAARAGERRRRRRI